MTANRKRQYVIMDLLSQNYWCGSMYGILQTASTYETFEEAEKVVMLDNRLNDVQAIPTIIPVYYWTIYGVEV